MLVQVKHTLLFFSGKNEEIITDLVQQNGKRRQYF